MNAKDLPPELPDSARPMNFTEMQDELTKHFVDHLGADEGEAQVRSHAAVRTLIDQQLIIWWGMGHDGQPVYIPRTKARKRSTHV